MTIQNLKKEEVAQRIVQELMAPTKSDSNYVKSLATHKELAPQQIMGIVLDKLPKDVAQAAIERAARGTSQNQALSWARVMTELVNVTNDMIEQAGLSFDNSTKINTSYNPGIKPSNLTDNKPILPLMVYGGDARIVSSTTQRTFVGPRALAGLLPRGSVKGVNLVTKGLTGILSQPSKLRLDALAEDQLLFVSVELWQKDIQREKASLTLRIPNYAGNVLVENGSRTPGFVIFFPLIKIGDATESFVVTDEGGFLDVVASRAELQTTDAEIYFPEFKDPGTVVEIMDVDPNTTSYRIRVFTKKDKAVAQALLEKLTSDGSNSQYDLALLEQVRAASETK